jgi:hypothetical protein
LRASRRVRTESGGCRRGAGRRAATARSAENTNTQAPKASTLVTSGKRRHCCDPARAGCTSSQRHRACVRIHTDQIRLGHTHSSSPGTEHPDRLALNSETRIEKRTDRAIEGQSRSRVGVLSNVAIMEHVLLLHAGQVAGCATQQARKGRSVSRRRVSVERRRQVSKQPINSECALDVESMRTAHV